MGIRGRVLRPGDPGYDEARAIWNGLIDRRPALIVQCSGAADVVDAVNFAREHGPAPLDQGRRPQRRRQRRQRRRARDRPVADARRPRRSGHADVRVQGGATWGDCDRETQLFGLAVPGGVVSTTGIAGLTLHGGVGHLRRKHGLTIDSLAVGRHRHRRRAAAAGERDRERGLFWAVRGAGSNFGVVTSFEFQAHPVGPMVDGRRDLLPARGGEDDPAGVARLHGGGAGGAELARDLLERARAASRSRPSSTGRRSSSSPASYSGSVEDGEPVVQPLRELGEPLHRPERPVALARPAERLRRALPEGRALLLEVAGARRALGRGDRRDRRLRGPPADAGHRHHRSGTTAAR